jgi:membrane protease YdiL (CAAX protease family)
MDDPIEPPEQSPESFLVMSILLEMGLGVVAVVFGILMGPDPRDVLPLPHQWEAILWGLGLGTLAAVPILIAVQIIERLPLEPIRRLQEATEERLLHAMSRLRVVDLLTVSICAGVGEELLFRGWLMMSLAGPVSEWQFWPLAAAVMVSSIVFGFAHPISPAYVVITGLIGVFLAMLLVWTENLLVPIAAHAVYDFVQLVIATRLSKAEAKSKKG